ncbi:MAG: hypothetical protein LBJ01_10070 [Tannerella sp.]|jgi:hypothetical protein|nr:hypothetical protein [Tannerella sp.]
MGVRRRINFMQEGFVSEEQVYRSSFPEKQRLKKGSSRFAGGKWLKAAFGPREVYAGK